MNDDARIYYFALPARVANIARIVPSEGQLGERNFTVRYRERGRGQTALVTASEPEARRIVAELERIAASPRRHPRTGLPPYRSKDRSDCRAALAQVRDSLACQGLNLNGKEDA